MTTILPSRRGPDIRVATSPGAPPRSALSIASLPPRSPASVNNFREIVSATFIEPNIHAAEYGEFDWIRAKVVPFVVAPSTEDGETSCQMIRRSLGENFDRAST